MAPKRANHRSQYVVEDPHQLRFTFRLFLMIVVIVLASALITLALLWKGMADQEPESQAYLIAACQGVALTLLVELLMAIPVLFSWSIRQTHQVVGPLHRITKVLETIGAGDFSKRLIIRDDDVLRELTSSINQMAESLQQRHAKSS